MDDKTTDVKDVEQQQPVDHSATAPYHAVAEGKRPQADALVAAEPAFR